MNQQTDKEYYQEIKYALGLAEDGKLQITQNYLNNIKLRLLLSNLISDKSELEEAIGSAIIGISFSGVEYATSN